MTMQCLLLLFLHFVINSTSIWRIKSSYIRNRLNICLIQSDLMLFDFTAGVTKQSLLQFQVMRIWLIPKKTWKIKDIWGKSSWNNSNLTISRILIHNLDILGHSRSYWRRPRSWKAALYWVQVGETNAWKVPK